MARVLAPVLMIGLLLGLAAGGARAQPTPPQIDPDCASYPCGIVLKIRQTTVKQTWTPLGASVGGYSTGPTDGGPGAVTSTFRIGPGLSNQGIVLLGAAGGAEYKKTPNSYEQPQWEVTVKLDNGRARSVLMRYEPFVREGDRVRVVGANLELL